MENTNNNGWFEELIRALDEERRKVEIFHRELPLSLHLIKQTIVSYKELMATNMNNPRQQELAVKELISLRPSSLSSSEEDATKQLDRQEILRISLNRVSPTLQLFTRDQQDQYPLSVPEMIWGLGNSNSLGNFEKEEQVINTAPVTTSDEDAGTAINGREGDDDDGDDVGSVGEDNLKKKNKYQKPHCKRKARRYWSEELQERFLLALEQLGGCHAATPKRIKKLMKVEGLTNDEIKSHLQKFRICKKRTNPVSRIPSINSKSSNEENNIETPNFNSAMVLGWIWIPTLDSQTGKFPQQVPLHFPLLLGNERFQIAKHAGR